MSRGERVDRPLKRSEYEIVFITRQAEKGWRDCLATSRNACVDAWDRLTSAPTREDERLYRLKADYATGTYNGRTYDRYQYKITSGGGCGTSWTRVPPARLPAASCWSAASRDTRKRRSAEAKLLPHVAERLAE